MKRITSNIPNVGDIWYGFTFFVGDFYRDNEDVRKISEQKVRPFLVIRVNPNKSVMVLECSLTAAKWSSKPFVVKGKIFNIDFHSAFNLPNHYLIQRKSSLKDWSSFQDFSNLKKGAKKIYLSKLERVEYDKIIYSSAYRSFSNNQKRKIVTRRQFSKEHLKELYSRELITERNNNRWDRTDLLNNINDFKLRRINSNTFQKNILVHQNNHSKCIKFILCKYLKICV